MKLLASCLALALSASTAFAQHQTGSPQGSSLDRLEANTRAAVRVLIDSARLAKVPTAPLVDRALEGSAKGADSATIVTAVRRLWSELVQARRVLGPASPVDEMRAAALALQAGLGPVELSKLHAISPKRSLTQPLTVLTDLVTRSVPVDTASRIVATLTKAGVRDADFSVFQRNVRVDIDHGADPTTAATTRARGVVLQGAANARPH